jgi:outer membrane protein OmpA-like peptidoglycan-associated protein
MSRRKPAALAVLAAVTALLAAGCSSLIQLASVQTVAAASCFHPGGVVLVIGAHRDVPAPSLVSSQDPRVACLVGTAIRDKKPVMIVVADGQPKVIHLTLPNGTGSLAQQNSPWVSQDLARVEAAVAAARPDSAGADDLAALAVAADAARTAGARHAWLVLLDSGLDDRGALDFTVPGLLAAAPAEVAGQLDRDGDLPPLHGFTVVLAGIGYTSPPQVQPSVKWRNNVTAIWTAVAAAAGARAEVIPVPVQGRSVRTGEPVEPVPVPAAQPVVPVTGRTFVLNGESAARFLPNRTAFADPAAASRLLGGFARWLAADPARQAWLVGTTADVGPMAGQVKLSVRRADRVRTELVALGASFGQISVRGVGSDFPQFKPDRSPSGTLLAGPATFNRTVRITLRSPASAAASQR